MTTYYVDGAVGNDTNAGTSEGSGNAWATIDKAMNTVATGDHVYVKASATYSETVTIDTSGGFGSPIVFEGYTTTTGDNGKATISGATNCLVAGAGTAHYIFKNLIFTGASSTGCNMGAQDNFAFYNCEFNSNGSFGIQGDNIYTFVNCEFNNNTSSGADVDTDGLFIGCISQGNGGSGLISTSSAVLYRCVLHNNGTNADGFQGVFKAVIGCTLDGENGGTPSGALDSASSTGSLVVVDNIIYDWGHSTAAVQVSTGGAQVGYVMGYNLMNSNAANYNISGDVVGYQDIATAPSFSDEAGDDYTLQHASPAVGAGIKPGGVT